MTWKLDESIYKKGYWLARILDLKVVLVEANADMWSVMNTAWLNQIMRLHFIRVIAYAPLGIC